MSSSTMRRRILVVEDEPSIRHIMCLLLAQMSCDTNAAIDNQQTLAWIEREDFDAVLLDMRCSNLEVEQVVPRIYELRPNLVGRVLVLTGEVADGATLEMVERYFLVRVPDYGLVERLAHALRNLSGFAPSPNPAQ